MRATPLRTDPGSGGDPLAEAIELTQRLKLPHIRRSLTDIIPPQADDLYELVSERQGRSLIITSNRAPSDWYPLFRNPVVAESLLDRLINASHQVIMNGPSYRPNKRPKGPAGKPPVN